MTCTVFEIQLKRQAVEPFSGAESLNTSNTLFTMFVLAETRAEVGSFLLPSYLEASGNYWTKGRVKISIDGASAS